MLIIADPIFKIKLAPSVQTMRFEGEYLSTPKGFSCEKTVIKSIDVGAKVA